MWAVGIALAAIAAATLPPNQQPEIADHTLCLICGGRGLADVLLNLMLFVPLGAALTCQGGSAWRVLSIGFGLSALIEVLQLGIPGRDPSFADLIANSLGAWAGSGLLRLVSWILDRSTTQPRPLLGAALAVAFAVLAAAAWLVQPGFPKTDYYGQWTPEFANMEQYQGHVRHAQVGGVPIPSTLVRESPRVRVDLLAGVPLRIEVQAGPPPNAPAPIFNIYDEHQREVIALAAERADLILRYRTRAAAIRLDQPSFRLEGALRSIRDGAALTIELRRAERGFCLAVNGKPACPLGSTAGSLWAVLVTPEAIPGRLEPVVNMVWLLGLFALVGFCVTRSAHTVVALGAVAGWLIAMPYFSGLLPTPAADLAAALAGLLGGRALRAWTHTRWGGTQATGFRAAARTNADTNNPKQRSMRA